MSNFFRAALLLLILGSCAARDSSAPRNLDNACSILTERPYYVRAFKQAERKWGIETHVLMAMIYQESKFIADNRPPHTYALGIIPMGRQSSALGYSQALDGTWEEYVDQHGRRRASRTNISDATDFMGWYMTATLRENAIPLNDTYNQYLAYHDGRTGWRRGTYRSKPWLTRIASKVRNRAEMYDAQLRTCRKFR
ncbi:MAG: transglycosylase SLT domain-containing protein [Octadecabacter sp.]|nr:transglycosylase SLT domain-containing protein [Octadecabacter sp.]